MMADAKYEKTFALIDKAGGPRLSNIKALSFGEKMKVNFNIFAFLFTIFYYIYIGSWKKGVTYFVISILLIVLLEQFLPQFKGITWLVTSAIFATRANIDLYKKYKLNDSNWI